MDKAEKHLKGNYGYSDRDIEYNPTVVLSLVKQMMKSYSDEQNKELKEELKKEKEYSENCSKIGIDYLDKYKELQSEVEDLEMAICNALDVMERDEEAINILQQLNIPNWDEFEDLRLDRTKL